MDEEALVRGRRHLLARFAMVVALVAGAGVATGGPARAVQAAPDCSKTLVVGVRGSGETQSDYYGFGQTVITALAGVRATYGNNITPIPVDYPAASISVLLQPGGLATYLTSVNQGVSALLNVVLGAAGTCPSQSVILLGYSQGAMVVHEALDAAATAWPALLNRVVGVALIADPLRLGGQPYEFGTASASRQGIGLAFNVAPPTDLPVAVRAHTRSVCNDGDPVCAFDLFNLQTSVHTSYSTNGYALVTGFFVGLLATPIPT
jgi:hypothetical protein